MKYKLIALDVDGTLINNLYEITAATRQTIREVHEQGAQIVLCTGRGPKSTLPLLEQLGLEGTVITHNGAVTVESQGSKLIHRFAFHMDQLKPFVDYCRHNHIHFDVNTAFEHYVEHLTDVERRMYEQYLINPVQVDDVMNIQEEVVKISIFAEGSVLDQLTLDWSMISHPQLKIIRSGDYFVDVMHKDANKGNALQSLALSLGIKSEHILAIGNYYNDMEMLDFAGLGIVMDNSPEDMKRNAQAVTATNDAEGVHLALQQYCLATTN
jgi:Cof subfamily protein (haloacid dehalogenase superfamily)